MRPPLLRTLILGALVGLPLLGAGGRVAMHIIGRVSGAPALVTAEGTFTVLACGFGAGAVGAFVYWLLAWSLPQRRLVRAVLFSIFLCLITLRGLRPVTGISAALFFPLVIVYGAVFEHLWHRRSVARNVSTRTSFETTTE